MLAPNFFQSFARTCTRFCRYVSKSAIVRAHNYNTTHRTSNRFVPRRALLYVPGHDQRKVEKTFKLPVDSIALDCEDGVALNKKAEARESIHNVLMRPYELNDLGVRINSLDTEFAAEDLKAALCAEYLPDTLLIPKVNSREDVLRFTALSKGAFRKKCVDLILYIESAMAMINIVNICKTAVKEGTANNFNLAALVFGGDDFIASIGAEKSDDCKEVMYARQKLVLVAKAFQVQAIDVVLIEYEDLYKLETQSLQGARLGFTGKQVIHPGQVDVVQKAFLPSKERVEWAISLLKSFDEHQQMGKGAFNFRGSMIDMPTMRQAQNIINLIAKTQRNV